MTLFYLFGFWAYIRSERHFILRFICVGASTCAALLAKETGITLPILCAAWELGLWLMPSRRTKQQVRRRKGSLISVDVRAP